MGKENEVVSNIVDFASGRHAKEEPDNVTVFAEAGLTMQYFSMDSRGKVNLIIENFRSFPEKLEALRDIVKTDIICEQEYIRNRNMDDIKVHTSGCADPTATAAINSVMIDDAINNISIEDVVRDGSMAAAYNRTLSSIEMMGHDYNLIKSFIRLLTDKDRDILEEYMNALDKMKAIELLAERENNMQYHSMYLKIRRIKIKLAKLAAPKLDKKYGGKAA